MAANIDPAFDFIWFSIDINRRLRFKGAKKQDILDKAKEMLKELGTHVKDWSIEEKHQFMKLHIATIELAYSKPKAENGKGQVDPLFRAPEITEKFQKLFK